MSCELVNGGTIGFELQRDEEGYREYKLVNLVGASNYQTGPYEVLQCPGLPIPGSAWQVLNDVDPWVWCRPDATVRRFKEDNGPGLFFEVEQIFSNKPLPVDKQRCGDIQIENPLQEPQKVSGTFVKYQEEVTHDRFGLAILNSGHEQVRGPQVEFDKNRPSVVIQQNVPLLQLDLLASMVDTVNNATLWGLPSRCVKLTNASWEKRYYGTCFVYYSRRLEFDISYKLDPVSGSLVSGFDRDILDESNKVINGHWGNADRGDTVTGWVCDPIPNYTGALNPDPYNPTHFIAAKDRRNENTKLILNGLGVPIGGFIQCSGTGTDDPGEAGTIHVEYYNESNMLLLGIPTVL